MSEDKPPKVKDLAESVISRIEEAKKESEIVSYRGTPGTPTEFKARDKHRAKLIWTPTEFKSAWPCACP